jgi:hypothetical protein
MRSGVCFSVFFIRYAKEKIDSNRGLGLSHTHATGCSNHRRLGVPNRFLSPTNTIIHIRSSHLPIPEPSVYVSILVPVLHFAQRHTTSDSRYTCPSIPPVNISGPSYNARVQSNAQRKNPCSLAQRMRSSGSIHLSDAAAGRNSANPLWGAQSASQSPLADL